MINMYINIHIITKSCIQMYYVIIYTYNRFVLFNSCDVEAFYHVQFIKNRF